MRCHGLTDPLKTWQRPLARVPEDAFVRPGCYDVAVMPPPYERHLFICTNLRPPGAKRPSCAARGSEAVRDAFKKELAGRGLIDWVRANASGCLDNCEHGISVVVYPDDVWYEGVTVEDVKEIVEEHILQGRPVERLRLKISSPPVGPKLPPILR